MRSRESLERVMEAGIQVLAEDGWQGFTLARVCDRAGVSVGLLYRRFRGREELLSALRDRWVDGMEASREQVTTREIEWQSLDPADGLRVAINGVVEGMRGQETVARVMDLYATYMADERRRMSEVSRSLAAWYRGGLMHYAELTVHDDAERAIEFSFRIVLDTMIRRATHGDDFATGHGIGDWDAFIGELHSACYAYLFGGAVSAAEKDAEASQR